MNDILQADQTQVIIQPKCVERPGTDVEEETNQIQSRKKRSPNRELRIDVSLIGRPNRNVECGNIFFLRKFFADLSSLEIFTQHQLYCRLSPTKTPLLNGIHGGRDSFFGKPSLFLSLTLLKIVSMAI